MLDAPTLQRDRVGLCRGALMQDREQIFEFASIRHAAPPRISTTSHYDHVEQPEREF
jgi:hypothetical protein